MTRFLSARTARFFVALFLSFTLGACGQAQSPPPEGLNTALDRYIAKEEPLYQWKKLEEQEIGKNRVVTLEVTSQTWQETIWRHKVKIVQPEQNSFPGTALLYLSGGDSVLETMLVQSLAGQIGATVIHVTEIPNQPLWKMREDDLIAHSLAQYIATGDETWPLLLPMTKGIVKALDAVQEYSAQQSQPLEKFIVTGASKRGWTTWLVGATDVKDRVIGIAPIVYDNLNIEKQMPHQLASWGAYSPMIDDYTRRGLQKQLESTRGQEVTRIIDPYTYRERFTMPKLLINGTNDPYWATDALNLYWNDLPEPRQIYYAPNSGHMLEGNYKAVLDTLVAWFKNTVNNKPIPGLHLEISAGKSPGKIGYLLKTEGAVSSARIWQTSSASRDFRKARWEASPMQKQVSEGENRDREGEVFFLEASIKDADTARFFGAFAEIEIASSDGFPLRISTPIEILPAQEPQ